MWAVAEDNRLFWCYYQVSFFSMFVSDTMQRGAKNSHLRICSCIGGSPFNPLFLIWCHTFDNLFLFIYISWQSGVVWGLKTSLVARVESCVPKCGCFSSFCSYEDNFMYWFYVLFNLFAMSVLSYAALMRSIHSDMSICSCIRSWTEMS